MSIEWVIKEAQKAGKAKPIDAHLATLFFLEAVQAIVKPDLLSQNGYSINEVFDTIVEVFFGGIAVPSALISESK